MYNMETETPAKLPAPATRDKEKQGTSASRRRGPGILIFVVVLLVLAVLAWWYFNRQLRERDDARIDELATQVSDLGRANEQLRRDIDSVRARANDVESMNRGIREEVLSFAERSRSLEDAVAHLAEQRLNNRDVMALNEAEFILQLAGERLALFRDAHGAMAAYRLADSALAAAEDPLFASVRQTISAEMQALDAAKPLQTAATLKSLADLRVGLLGLPMKSAAERVTTATPAERSRLREILDQFVRISHDDGAPALAARDEKLSRSLIAIDLRAAEAALFARDQEAFEDAVKRAHAGVEANFDSNAPAVRTTLATLEHLAATPLAPALPELGTALNELRNLRTTRALAHPMKPVPTPLEVSPGGEPKP